MDAAVKKEMQELLDLMRSILNDRLVPRNIRAVIDDAMQKIGGKKPKVEDFSTAIYLFDDISADINMPTHTRTDIWEAISKMEAIKEKIKELPV